MSQEAITKWSNELHEMISKASDDRSTPGVFHDKFSDLLSLSFFENKLRYHISKSARKRNLNFSECDIDDLYQSTVMWVFDRLLKQFEGTYKGTFVFDNKMNLLSFSKVVADFKIRDKAKVTRRKGNEAAKYLEFMRGIEGQYKLADKPHLKPEVVQKFYLEILPDMIDELPPNLAALLRARYIGGMTYSRIEAVFGISPKTARIRIENAIGILKDNFKHVEILIENNHFSNVEGVKWAG